MAKYDALEAYINLTERRLEIAKDEVAKQKRWINDLLNESDSAIMLNVDAHAGRLAVAIARAMAIENDLATLRDYMSSEDE